MNRLAYRLGNDTSFSRAVWLSLRDGRDARESARRRPLLAPAAVIAAAGILLPLVKIYHPEFLPGVSSLAGPALCFAAGLLARLEKLTATEGGDQASSQRPDS